MCDFLPHWINALELKVGFSSFFHCGPVLFREKKLLEAKEHILNRGANNYGGAVGAGGKMPLDVSESE